MQVNMGKNFYRMPSDQQSPEEKFSPILTSAKKKKRSKTNLLDDPSAWEGSIGSIGSQPRDLSVDLRSNKKNKQPGSAFDLDEEIGHGELPNSQLEK